MDDLFVLRNAAAEFVTLHPDNPNKARVDEALESTYTVAASHHPLPWESHQGETAETSRPARQHFPRG